MARPMDSYTVIIRESHIDWGRYRHTNTRDPIAGEAYVKIPREYAILFDIRRGDCYTAVFADGFSSFQIRAAGNIRANDIYAKQFQGDGDLKAFGRWYSSVGAKTGDRVTVTFLDNQTIEFQLNKA